ncbi:MAG: isopentenyl-diphosphate Delta-isomerase [Bacteroidota bacterium]|nr:isopentenyl-diphosphate Delta-isomerase [Bacteroidota bacterium]
MLQQDHVILVNEKDEPTGTMEKLQAHQEGRLHRAFSIFIFDFQNRLLLQKRAHEKYHSANLWSNTCCSHPAPHETLASAMQRKLPQEMGFTCDLKKVFEFTYKAALENGLTEHELDHVYIGRWDGQPRPNSSEVSSWKWETLDNIRQLLKYHPASFTPWFKLLFERVAGIIELKEDAH